MKPDQSQIEVFHQLIDELDAYATDPYSWPLSPEDQQRFVRHALGLVRSISSSEPYRRDAVLMKAKEFVDFQKKPAKSKKP